MTPKPDVIERIEALTRWGNIPYEGTFESSTGDLIDRAAVLAILREAALDRDVLREVRAAYDEWVEDDGGRLLDQADIKLMNRISAALAESTPSSEET